MCMEGDEISGPCSFEGLEVYRERGGQWPSVGPGVYQEL